MKRALAVFLVACSTNVLAAAGDFDVTFGSGGFATLFGSARTNSIDDIATDSTGRIYAAGFMVPNGRDPIGIRVRMRADGTSDPGFGNQGQQFPNNRIGLAVRIDAQDRPIYIDRVPGGAVVERLLENGEPDPAFGSVNVGGGSAAGVAQLPDGTLVLLLSPATNQYALSALAPDQTVDARWVAATSSLACPGSTAAASAQVVAAPGSRVVVVLAIDNVGLCVVRFQANGSLDATFGSGGRALIPVTVPIELQGVAVDREGGIAVAYAAVTFLGPPSTVAYITASGTLDASRALSTGNGLPHFVTSIAFQPDGKPLVTGYPGVRIRPAFDTPDLARPTLFRFTVQPALDPSFGPAPGGSVRLVDGARAFALGKVFLDANNRILVLGGTGNLFDKGLVRLLNDVPAAAPVDNGGGGGGGCGTLGRPGPFDPLFPTLLFLSAFLLWSRRKPRCTS